ncbi:MAG: hypothetical protein KDC83_03400 [Flavobacteriales bacterium]|nr:hypothetical protein [Flavobacteriales bacterium]
MYFDTTNKKRGLAGTILVHLLLLILFIIYGLNYPVPRPETGMLLNFGTSDMGSGEIQPDVAGDPSPQTDPNEEIIPPTESSSSNAQDDQVLTQDEIETLTTPENDDSKKTESENATKPKDNSSQSTTEESKEPKKEPQLDSRLKNTLENAFNKGGGSEGDDKNKSGDKGKVNGDKQGNSYTGGTGGSGGGNYNLGDRNALAKIKPDYTCEEYGIVVISVRVNRNGQTVDANLQLKGTSNTAPCLVNRAKEAALKTKWQPDPAAPEIQIGSITYHFELN